MTSARIALRGQGILRQFNEAGVFAAADVHVALRLAELGGGILASTSRSPPPSRCGRCGPGRCAWT